MALHGTTAKSPRESCWPANRTVVLDDMVKQNFRLIPWDHATVVMEVSNSYIFLTH